jgi:hypothetical protein
MTDRNVGRLALRDKTKLAAATSGVARGHSVDPTRKV